jgi:hypothetical protein
MTNIILYSTQDITETEYTVVRAFKQPEDILTNTVDTYNITILEPGIYSIKNDGEINNSVNNLIKLMITENATSSTGTIIEDTTFNRMVILKFDNIIRTSPGTDAVSFEYCTFKCEGIDGDPAIFSVEGEGKEITFDNVIFKYKDRIAVATQEANTFNVTNSYIDILPDNDISLENLTSTISLTDIFMDISFGNKIRLDNDENGTHVFQPIGTNMIFHVIGGNDIHIHNTTFTRSCEYILEDYDISVIFHNCEFNNNLSDTYLGESSTTGTGRIKFAPENVSGVYIATNKFYPNFTQMQTNQLWNDKTSGTITSLEEDPIPINEPEIEDNQVYVLIYLDPNNYSNVASVDYFDQGIFLPTSTAYPYIFGRSDNKIDRTFKFMIDDDADNSTSLTLDTTFYSNCSIRINNKRNDIDLLINTNSDITATKDSFALVDDSDELTGNHNITIRGKYYNNEYNIIDPKFIATVNNAEFYYISTITGDNRIDMDNENKELLKNYNKTFIDCENLQIRIPVRTDLDGNYPKFTIPIGGSASFYKSAIFMSTLFNLNNIAFGIDNSYIDLVQTGFLDINNTTNTVSVSNSVIDLHDSEYIIFNNKGTGSHNVHNNTINLLNYNMSFTSFEYNQAYVANNNIFNMSNGEGDYTFNNVVLDKDIRIACNENCSITYNDGLMVDGRGVLLGNQKWFIWGDKLTTDIDYFIQNGGSDATLTIKDIIFRGKSLSPGYIEEYINYTPENNDYDGKSITILLDPVDFVITSTTSTFNIGYDASHIIYEEGGVKNYKVICKGFGNFLLGNDPLVKECHEVFFQETYANANSAILSGTTSSNLFDGRLSVVIDDMSGPSTTYKIAIKAKGLDLSDIVDPLHTININNDTFIDVSDSVDTTENCVNILSNGATMLLNIAGGEYKANDKNAMFNILSSTQNANSDRKLTVENTATLTQVSNTALTYYIENSDSLLLDINQSPSGDILRNIIYWPSLTTMYSTRNTYDRPLSGNSVMYAESWDITTIAHLKNYINNDAVSNDGLQQGLRLYYNSADINNVSDVNLTVDNHTWDTDVLNRTTNDEGRHLDWVIAYSKDAIEINYSTITLENIEINMTKTFTNTETNHTGKLRDGFVYDDQQVHNDATVNGWLLSQIYFNSDKMVIMPTTINNSAIELYLNSDLSKPIFHYSNVNNNIQIYEIESILTINDEDIWDYLYENCERLDSGAKIVALKNESVDDVSDPIMVRDEMDGQIEVAVAREFSIRWVLRGDFEGSSNVPIYFLDDITINIDAIIDDSAPSNDAIYLGNSVVNSMTANTVTSFSMVYHGIDNIPISWDLDSEPFIVQFLKDPLPWAWKKIQVQPLLFTYTGITDAIREYQILNSEGDDDITTLNGLAPNSSGFEIMFKNSRDDGQLFGIPLDDITDTISNEILTISTVLTLSNSYHGGVGKFLTDYDGNNRIYEWSGWVGLVIPASNESLSVSYDPNDSNNKTKLLINDDPSDPSDGVDSDDPLSDPRGTVELTRYVYNTTISNWVEDPSNNVITKTDTVYRYKVSYIVDRVRDRYVNTNYTLQHEQLPAIMTYNNSNPETTGKNLIMTVKYLNIPLHIDIRNTLPANIENENYEPLPFNGNVPGNIEVRSYDNGEYDIYTGTIQKGENCPIYIVFSGKVKNAQFNLEFVNDSLGMTWANSTVVSNNVIDMSEFINSVEENTLDMIEPNQASNGPINITDVNNNQVIVKLFNPNYILGEFKIKVELDSFKFKDNFNVYQDYVFDTESGRDKVNNLILFYTDGANTQSIKFRLDKVLDRDDYEYIPRLDVKNPTSNESYVANEYNITNADGTTVLIPENFDRDSAISSSNLIPFNKYTQYYFSVETTSLSLYVENGVAKADNPDYINVELVFRNMETGDLVDDIECYTWDETSNKPTNVNNVITQTTDIEIDNLETENLKDYSSNGAYVSGNKVMFFRRKINPITPPELSYAQLGIFYKFLDLDLRPGQDKYSNYVNLGDNETLLGTIDYSNVALGSLSVSQLVIGNWRVLPSGDGQKLLFRKVMDGSNPNEYMFDVTKCGTTNPYPEPPQHPKYVNDYSISYPDVPDNTPEAETSLREPVAPFIDNEEWMN